MGQVYSQKNKRTLVLLFAFVYTYMDKTRPVKVTYLCHGQHIVKDHSKATDSLFNAITALVRYQGDIICEYE